MLKSRSTFCDVTAKEKVLLLLIIAQSLFIIVFGLTFPVTLTIYDFRPQNCHESKRATGKSLLYTAQHIITLKGIK